MSTTQTSLVAGRYRLVKQLGQGGMGRVWLARDQVLHRDVAIKEVAPPANLPAEERASMGERSLREARAIARLTQPNVVRVFDIVQQHPWPYIVMEYVPSRSLEQVLKADGPLDPVAAAHLGLGVLGALRAAHRIGMRHRDVKPGNVLLADDGRTVLTDFGLAMEEGDPTVTRPGIIIGSPAFMAPERAAQGHSTAAADLWSLGATLFAAVEGQSPYSRPNAMATLAALATEEPDPAPHAGPLAAVIAGLLQRVPERRMSAAEAARRLHAIANPARVSTVDGGDRVGRRPRFRSALARLARPGSRSAGAARPAAGSPAADPAGAGSAVSGSPVADSVEAAPPVADPAAAGPPGSARAVVPVGTRPAEAAEDDPALVDDAVVDGPVVDGPVVDGAVVDGAVVGGAVVGGPAVDGAVVEDGPAEDGPIAGAPVDSRSADSRPVGSRWVVSHPARGRAAGPRPAGPRPAGSRLGTASRSPIRSGSAGTRWVVLTVVLAALVTVALLINSARSPAAGPTLEFHAGMPAATPGASRPAVPGPTASGSASPSPATTGFTMPAGWHWYHDPTGFSVAIPDRWTLSHKGTMVYFHEPNGSRLLGIDQRSDPQWNPVADWTQQEQYRVSHGDFPAYQRIRIAPVRYFIVAADWEFRFTASGIRVHVINRGVVTSAHQAYGFWWETPDAQWSASLSYFQTIMASFQPHQS